jgi:hypothetical protein
MQSPNVIQAIRVLNPSKKKGASRTARKTVTKVMQLLNRQAVPEQLYPYRSASIIAKKSRSPCGAVGKLAGARFLLSGVPKLPLADCTSEHCSCSYSRYKDRRSVMDERRALLSLRTDLHSLSDDHERRELVGRRSNDEALFDASDSDISLFYEMK